MMMYTHVAGAVLLGTLLRPFFTETTLLIYYTIVVATSFIPDMDHPTSWINNKLKITKAVAAIVEHRGIFHSAWLGITIGIAAYFINPIFVAPAVIGFASHLLLDSLTPQGINYLHPLTTLHLRGPIFTNSWKETLALGVIIASIILYFW